MAYDNTNTGVLFAELNKTNERGPDYTGKLDVNGTEYRLAGWKKQGARGTFLSLKVELPRGAQGGGGYAPASGGFASGGLDDEIPF